MSSDWNDIQRVESWAGELRVNAIRLIGIVVFYGRHMIQFMLAASDSPTRGVYHLRVTWLAVLWAAEAAALHYHLSRRRCPPEMKYFSTAWDIIMITLLCVFAGGPRTPFVLLFFPVIAMSPLRLSLKLVYFATFGAVAGYLCVLGAYVWYVIGYEKYYATPALRIPRSEEAIVILALLVTGLLAGQMVRQARRISAGYPQRAQA